MERALVVVYNWVTKDLHHMVWEEEDAGMKAAGWLKGIEEEYPPAHGWTYCVHMNDAAKAKFNVRDVSKGFKV